MMKIENVPPQDLIKTREAAALLGCSTVAMREWRLHGKGPRWWRFDRLVYYSRADIIALGKASAASLRGGVNQLSGTPVRGE